MGKRRKSREIAMQMLFQADLGRQSAEQVQSTFWEAREKVDPGTQGFAEDIFRVAIARQEEIDTYIATASEHWRLERMAAVDRNLLRGAIAEMLGYPATPLPIIINETLEIARLYAAPGIDPVSEWDSGCGGAGSATDRETIESEICERASGVIRRFISGRSGGGISAHEGGLLGSYPRTKVRASQHICEHPALPSRKSKIFAQLRPE